MRDGVNESLGAFVFLGMCGGSGVRSLWRGVLAGGARAPRCAVACERGYSRAISWNVRSLPRLLRRNPRALHELVEEFDPDILCLQGTMLRKEHEHLFKGFLPGFIFPLFNSSITRLGCKGTAMLSKRILGLSQYFVRDDPCDREGQYVEAECGSFILATVQNISPGSNFQRLDKRLAWDSALRQQMRTVQYVDQHPVVLFGDLAVARRDEDVYDPDLLRGSPGFSHLERQSLEDTIESCGFVDAYRLFYPSAKGKFTYWGSKPDSRIKNHGMRRDYALVTEGMVDAIRDVHILDQVQGSDHCPIAIDFKPGMIH